MKSIYHIAIALLLSITLVACKQDKKSNQNTASSSEELSIEPGIDGVITQYINLKNALLLEDSADAAQVGDLLKKALVNLGTQKMNDSERAIYEDITEAAKEDAEHISEMEDNLKHQREHFLNLSEDIFELTQTFKPSNTLYRFYYQDRDESWFSDKSIEDKNPYGMNEQPTLIDTLK